MAEALASSSSRNFWDEIKNVNRSCAPLFYHIDGLCATVIRHLRVFGPLKDNDLNGMIDTLCSN